jgi:hypothetical protein
LKRFKILQEQTQFHFPEGCFAYEEHGAEGEYHRVPVKDITSDCERPLTVVYPDGTHAAVLDTARQADPRRGLVAACTKWGPGFVDPAAGGLKHPIAEGGFIACKVLFLNKQHDMY